MYLNVPGLNSPRMSLKDEELAHNDLPDGILHNNRAGVGILNYNNSDFVLVQNHPAERQQRHSNKQSLDSASNFSVGTSSPASSPPEHTSSALRISSPLVSLSPILTAVSDHSQSHHMQPQRTNMTEPSIYSSENQGHGTLPLKINNRQSITHISSSPPVAIMITSSSGPLKRFACS